MDIWEIICGWYDKQSISYIANTLSDDHKTVRKYVNVAKEPGITRDFTLPAKEKVINLIYRKKFILFQEQSHDILIKNKMKWFDIIKRINNFKQSIREDFNQFN